MAPISDRQETILALIVREYTESSQPVGSNRLVKRYTLGVSSATIRNEMAALTEAGFLRQPHTSAGRVPTEDGYRYFVRQLLVDTDLPTAEKRLISHQFHQVPADMDEWVRLSTSILAQQSKMASLATSPRPDLAVFKHLELIATRGSQVLMVLVLQGGDVRQQMLTLAQVMDQSQLDQASAMINELFGGKSADAIAAIPNLTDLAQDIAKLVAETMERADAFWTGDVYRDGITNVLSMPEFASSESARSALRLLEERSFLEEVLSNVLSPNVDEVQVVIGGEGDWEDLKDCSMVLARYGAPGYATGALGVLGPTRMSYGRTISAVRYVAGLLSDLVIEAFATDIDNPQ